MQLFNVKGKNPSSCWFFSLVYVLNGAQMNTHGAHHTSKETIKILIVLSDTKTCKGVPAKRSYPLAVSTFLRLGLYEATEGLKTPHWQKRRGVNITNSN